ncbi:MAG: class I SAM-dependent methyltransferase [Gaiellales bacterium]|nr:MAG: class I SAM-dependent methyltransferase [Gaiellales bacterium]
MERIPEPELMLDEEQARVYAGADFEEPHENFIEEFRLAFPDVVSCGFVLDLGCGPGDISARFARAFPECEVHGIDGSRAMLKFGRMIVGGDRGLEKRIRLCYGLLPDFDPPRDHYDIVISNSLLHHLADPMSLWDTARRLALPGAPVFVMDLMRPASADDAVRLVKAHAGGEPELLQHDFYHSLLAAYRLDEVREQLRAARLDHFVVQAASDRHLVAYGRV